jgi:hypothetical protein
MIRFSDLYFFFCIENIAKEYTHSHHQTPKIQEMILKFVVLTLWFERRSIENIRRFQQLTGGWMGIRRFNFIRSEIRLLAGMYKKERKQRNIFNDTTLCDKVFATR